MKVFFEFFKKDSALAKLEEEAVIRAVTQAIKIKSYYGFGDKPYTRQLEKNISKFLGGRPVIGTNSGTDALILALKLAGVSYEDEVIVPAFSFISTASSVAWLGAKTVFADIRMDDYALDPKEVEKKITPRTKAIILVHHFGQPAIKSKEIAEISRKYNLILIEDAAQSLGATLMMENQEKRVGTIGDIACLSFASTKSLGTIGNGGALVVAQEEFRKRAAEMRTYGARIHYQDYPLIGVNCALQEVQAAALVARLAFWPQWLQHREKLADIYSKNLREIQNLFLPTVFPETRRIWYRYVVRTTQRDKLFAHLKRSAGADVKLFPNKNYPVPLPYLGAFKNLGHREGEFPVAESLSQEVLSLPLSNLIAEKDALFVAKEVRNFFDA